jgi:hypothetical protein
VTHRDARCEAVKVLRINIGYFDLYFTQLVADNANTPLVLNVLYSLCPRFSVLAVGHPRVFHLQETCIEIRF